MSTFHRCDYCGTECGPGSGMADQKVWIEPKPSSKSWAKDHSVGRTSRVKVLVGIDGINPEPNHPGHDLCDPCVALHLREMLARLDAEDGAWCPLWTVAPPRIASWTASCSSAIWRTAAHMHARQTGVGSDVRRLRT